MPTTLSARVGRVIAGSVHALLDRLEDQAPEAMMEQAVRELDEVVADVRAELGTAAANRHVAQQQHADLNRKHVELVASAEHAIAAERDDLARAAVARQLDIEVQLPVLEAALADLAGQEAQLKAYVDALLGKKREMHDAIEVFRSSRAKATGAAGPGAVGGGAGASAHGKVDEAAAAFDRVYARHTGTTPAASGATLDQASKLRELDDLVRAGRVEERLARLKSGRQT